MFPVNQLRGIGDDVQRPVALLGAQFLAGVDAALDHDAGDRRTQREVGARAGTELREPRLRALALDRRAGETGLGLAQAGLEQGWRVAADFGTAQTDVTLRGQMLGLRPLAPVRLKAVRQGDDLLVSWIRRARVGGDSWEVGEVPLAEEREAYRLDIFNGASLRRSVTVAEPFYLYRAADIAAEFGAGAADFTLRVAQLSTTFGPGAFMQRTIHA